MQIEKKYLARYLHDIAIDQLSAKYTALGYEVMKEYTIDSNHQVDLMVKKREEVIVFEVTGGSFSTKKKEKMEKLSQITREKGYKCKIIWATPPQEKSIQIKGLDILLFNYIKTNSNELSTKYEVKEVNYVQINLMDMNENGSIHLIGNGLIIVYYDKEDIEDSFPFNFNIWVKYTGKQLLEVEKIEHIQIENT